MIDWPLTIFISVLVASLLELAIAWEERHGRF